MPKRNLAWILLIAMITLMMWQLPQTIAGRDAVYKAFGPLADVKAQIRKRFVHEPNDAELTRVAVEAGIRAMVERLGDPHAVYLNKSEYERFKSRTEGSFGGIGVDVGATPLGIEVLSRDPHSPAAEADILPGDIITHVDGTPTDNISLVVAVGTLLNGPPGSDVTLTVVRPSGGKIGEPREVTLQRAIIRFNPVRGWSRSTEGGWRYMLDPDLRIGYIRLTKFTHDAAQKLDTAMQRLLDAGMRGLILDLRENTGGLLDSARDLTDRFLDSGLIVRVSGRRADEKQWFAMRDGTYPNIPMAVIINGSSASASEIFAGALRDHRRAEVVGERSYGKGSVQEVVELDGDNGAVKMTTAYYYLPSGRSIDRTSRAGKAGDWGVTPTVPVPLTEEQRRTWLALWREVGREVTTRPAATSGTEADAISETDEDPAAESAADPAWAEAARIVLEGDIQLRAALELMQKRLARPATREATGEGATPAVD